jgi:hypothetical protein
MANTFNRFQSLVGRDSVTVVTITANNGDGTSNATTLSGNAITVKGESVTSGNNAFIRGDEIIRSAPNLTPTFINV